MPAAEAETAACSEAGWAAPDNAALGTLPLTSATPDNAGATTIFMALDLQQKRIRANCHTQAERMGLPVFASTYSRHHVNNWLADSPYRRAVAETCRRLAWLSATIRCFSADAQRRRAPVEITSRRETFEPGVWSVIRLCLHPYAASRKTILGGGIRFNGQCRRTLRISPRREAYQMARRKRDCVKVQRQLGLPLPEYGLYFR